MYLDTFIFTKKQILLVALTVICSLISSITIIFVLRVISTTMAASSTSQINHWLPLAGLLLIVFGSGLVAQLSLNYIGGKIVHDLRDITVKKILSLSYEKQESLGAAKINSILNDSINKVSRALESLPTLILSSSIIIFCLAYLCYLSTKVFSVVAFLLAGGLCLSLTLTTMIKKLYIKSYQQQENIQQDYHELVNGVKELQFSQKAKNYFINTQFLKNNRALMLSRRLADNIWALSLNWNNLFLLLLIVGVAYSAHDLGQDKFIISANFALVVLLLRAPIMMLLEVIPTILEGKIALNKMNTLFDDKIGNINQNKNLSVKKLEFIKSLNLKNICYSYKTDDDYQYSIGPLSIDFHAGSITFITGGNGSGKTTLGKLISGLYHTDSGSINVNCDTLTSQKSYKNCVSAIFNDFYILPYNHHNLNKADMEKANVLIKDMGLDKKICTKKGWNNSTPLSQGQRKRLAFLNLLLQDKNICIFDEWASDQDKTHRDLFYKKYLPNIKKQGKIVIVITHDDDYFKFADKIYQMKNGNIFDASQPDVSDKKEYV